jgi:hypothetical protein
MAKNAGSFLLAEHYINSLLVHAILYKLPDIIDDVNEIREHYHVPPYPDLKAALASSTEKSQPENGLPSLEEQARDIYIHLNDKAQRMLLKDCLQLLIIEHPNMFQQNVGGQSGSHQQYRLFKKIKPGKDFFEDKPEQYDKEKTGQPQ